MIALRAESVIRNFLTLIFVAASNEALSAAVCLNVAWVVAPGMIVQLRNDGSRAAHPHGTHGP